MKKAYKYAIFYKMLSVKNVRQQFLINNCPSNTLILKSQKKYFKLKYIISNVAEWHVLAVSILNIIQLGINE